MAASETDVSKRKDAATIRQRRAKVTFSYEPQNEDELALKVGDELIVSGEDEEGWYQAKLNGKSGVCPSNFLELLPDGDVLALDSAASDMDTAKEKKPSGTTDAATKELKEKLSNSLTRGQGLDVSKRHSVLDPAPAGAPSAAAAALVGDKKTAEGQEEPIPEIAAKKVKGVGLGNIFAGGAPSKDSLRSTSDTNGNKEKLTGPTEKKAAAATNEVASSLKDSSGAEYAKADYDYEALNPDELSFKAGDIIQIVTKDCEDDGWWRGQLSGRSGVFPDNFCSVIPLSEVPAPSRPTRTPSADKAGFQKKDDKNEKENHQEKIKPGILHHHDDSHEKDKVEKSSLKKDEHLHATDKSDLSKGVLSKKDEKDKDKVEKTPAKEDSGARNELRKTPLKPTGGSTSPEKKPDRPEKPVLKPVVGKKPIGGTSRENTPPVVPDAKSDLKSSHSSGAAADAKAKHADSAADGAKHLPADEPKSRGTSGTSTSGVRLRHVESAESRHSVIPSATSSAAENGGAVGFDSVNSSEKLVHPTASRAKGPTRRPPSQLFRPASEEDGSPLFSVANGGGGGTNGVDSGTTTDDMAKDRELKPARSTGDGAVARKDSFLKQLDSVLSQPKSPTSVTRRVSDLPSASTSTAGSLEDEVKTLKDEVKCLKEDFATQMKELRTTLKLQADKIASLEKDLEKARKGDK